MRNWDLGEFHVRVELPSPIWQVRVSIRHVITPIRHLPNPIRHVVPLISHIHSYPTYLSHLHPISLASSSTTLPSMQNTKLNHPSLSLHAMIMSWHRVQHTPSIAYTKYSIHQVQPPPSTASTQDCLSSFHSHDYELTSDCTFSFRCASLHDRPPSASSPWEFNGTVPLSQSHGCEVYNWGIESQHPVSCPLTASKNLSEFTRSRPSSESPNSLDHGLQVHLQARLIMASKCIARLARLQPACLHNQSLQVHRQTRSITASRFARSWPWSAYLHPCSITASKFAWSWPPQVHISNLAQSQPRCVSPYSLDYALQVHLQTHSIMFLECISKFAQSRPPTVSPNTLNYHLQIHLQTRLIMALVCISESTQWSFPGAYQIALKHCLQPHLIYPV